MADTLRIPTATVDAINSYLSNYNGPKRDLQITLTYATSMDSHLSIRPGVQTSLSGPESKAMTHVLRTIHDAILVGSGTAIADDPGLNSRIAAATMQIQPRPLILDRRGRWNVTEESKVIRLAAEGKGKAPWLLTNLPDARKQALLEKVGGRLILLSPSAGLKELADICVDNDINSLMIEGGGTIINEFLGSPVMRKMIHTVIVTVAPTYLGRGGVNVSPDHASGEEDVPVCSFKDVTWLPMGQDVVMLGKIA